MLKSLQTKWKVGPGRLLLILVCFATGGSLCGILGRKILGLLELEKGVVWVMLYLVLITLLWPVCVLAISIPLGQINFFRNYIHKIFSRMTGNKIQEKKLLAVFASGAGSNAEKIIQHFNDKNKQSEIRVTLVVCNKPGAGVLQIAEKYELPVLQIQKEIFYNGDHFLPALQESGITHIILAGFLLKIPAALVNAYKGKILNIHPALLPKYGGPGMYGAFVHKAVIAAGDKKSGITIHEVDEIYDNGKTIFQDSCDVVAHETAETLANKIHVLEHKHFAQQIEKWIEGCYEL